MRSGPSLRRAIIGALIAAVSSAAPIAAESRWEDAIRAFEAQDAASPPAEGGVLFIGSSSIRLWDLAACFPELDALNRGFGGSQVSDSVEFVSRIVHPYAPATIVMYAGDNDIAAGESPETVHADFVAFVDAVRAELPKARIAYIAIKPSLARWNLVESMRRANALIRETIAKDPLSVFLDIDTPMLGEDGKPRAELLVEDGLHLSPAGYELWSSIVRPHVGGAAPYLGRWDIVLANTGTTFRSATLALEETAGGVRGEVVWRWGSVIPVRDTDLRVERDGALRVACRGIPGVLTVRRVGEFIECSMRLEDGSEQIAIGRRSTFTPDLTGAWAIDLHAQDGVHRGTLELTSEGGVLRGVGRNEEGAEVTLDDLRQDGERILFSFLTGNDHRLEAELTCRGDRAEGHVTLGGTRAEITGTRRTNWGQPVDLLAHGLNGWMAREPSKTSGWAWEDGQIVNASPGNDLVSKETFGDLSLSLEYRIDEPRGNSGIYLHGRYEVQVLDDSAAGRVEPHGNGAVYSRVAPTANVTRKPLEWQECRIVLRGRYVTVTLNGRAIVDNQRIDGITGGALDPFENEAGPLMLQGDHGRVRYRNVRVARPE